MAATDPYRLSVAPKVWFIGVNWLTWTVVGAVFAIAPVAVLMSAGQFSEKNLARKLK